ncbi:MAG: Asp-tRNA(Asn)/Glu-tRNA(Gln) amidotransferase subunit GatB [Clostridia bacterium]|nr:Asp-tRNA(Asn)/Glu-tRNA(Gln) amidotransferase subunit GatB [Clostridia bacterium]
MMEYDIVIGLEVHAELKTNSKVFCSCKNQFGSAPNTNCCPVCIGLPGALPVLNKKAVELVIKAGLAIGGEINEEAIFERKNYFYPDLSKAYQISQLVKPICVGGHLKVGNREVQINRIHLEEDAGKLTHSGESGLTMVDYNRGGVPLMELVTEPDIHSAEEAVEFLTNLRSILVFADVAECKMEQGGMRCDVNVSIKPKGSEKLGNRTEMKNLNSFKSVERAIKYEVERQAEVLDKGGVVTQETRKWDDDAGISYAMRKKETSQDYRYFPDPDLLSVHISREKVAEIKKTLPLMPHELKEKYIAEFGLTEYEADIITREKKTIAYFEEASSICNQPKQVSNWLLTDVLAKAKESDGEILLSAKELGLLIKLIADGKVNRAVAKEIFAKVWAGEGDVQSLAQKLGGSVDEGQLAGMIDDVIAQNPKAVADYHASEEKDKLIKWFVGQVMKVSRGKANPTQAEQLIKQKLN